jgi:hypothetical protein
MATLEEQHRREELGLKWTKAPWVMCPGCGCEDEEPHPSFVDIGSQSYCDVCEEELVCIDKNGNLWLWEIRER